MNKKLNKIDELIKELCPEGVEFKSIQKLLDEKTIATVIPPKKLTKKYYQDIGKVPIIDQGQNFIVAYTNDENVIVEKAQYVIFGDHTEAIKYVDFAFAQGADGIKILKTNGVNTKYFYYSLKIFYKKTGKYTRHFSFLKKFKIPIPPLHIQEEIVKILDNFTELEAELETELEARKKQYEYYREELFNIKDAKCKTLGEIGSFLRGRRFVKNDIISKGVPCVHYGEMYTYYNIWAKETKSFLDANLAKKLRVAHSGDVIIVAAGETIEDLGKGVAWLGNSDVVVHDACYIFSHNLNPKYISYFLRTKRFHSQIKRFISSGKISSINAKGLEKATIPIPPLPLQEEIVKTLDKFDTLVNDISIGLPAELSARRKQYEYYRENLFNQLRIKSITN